MKSYGSLYILLFLLSWDVLAQEVGEACFSNVSQEVKDIPWQQKQPMGKLHREDIVALQQKWFRLGRQKKHQSLYKLTTPNFRVIRIRPNHPREVDIREEYFLNLALWFARGGVLLSLKRENELIEFSKNGNWAVYEADIWQTVRTGDNLVRLNFHEKSYITLYKGHARYAAFCSKFRKIVQVPSQVCGKSI